MAHLAQYSPFLTVKNCCVLLAGPCILDDEAPQPTLGNFNL